MPPASSFFVPQRPPLCFVRSLPLKSARVSKSTEERAESKASIQSVLGGMKAAQAEKDAARQLQAQATEARATAKAAAATAARSLNPKRYGDADYWEERHAKSRASGETFEWYTGYPDEALQKVTYCRSFFGIRTNHGMWWRDDLMSPLPGLETHRVRRL